MSIDLARELRKRMPLAEARVWNLLRGEPFDSWHFRRQVPVGRYFADFASHRAHLVVEIDGDSHGLTMDSDAERDRFIRAEGYRVLRISNRDVMNNLEGVAAHLSQVFAAHPHPTPAGPPSPQGGGRK